MDGTQLDVVSNFCYLGDMLCDGGGCKLAMVTRCSTAWGKFKRLLPILTSKHVSLRTRGKVFNACVHSALLHGSETWASTAPDLQRLRLNDRSMVRWICGVRDDDEVSSDSLCAMFFFFFFFFFQFFFICNEHCSKYKYTQVHIQCYVNI